MHKILVVDDERRIADMVQSFLSRMGFEAAKAYGGEEALSLFKSGARFDLLIIDMRMPKVSGFEVIKSAAVIDKAMPVIVLTGTVDATRCLAELDGLGFSDRDVLRKPADLFELLALVKSKLGVTGEAAQSA